MAKNRLAVESLVCHAYGSQELHGLKQARPWTAVPIRLRGCTIVFISLYLDCSIGLRGNNVAILQDLGGWLSLLGAPWLILADWNMPLVTLQG